jgi:hypothetical protein
MSSLKKQKSQDSRAFKSVSMADRNVAQISNNPYGVKCIKSSSVVKKRPRVIIGGKPKGIHLESKVFTSDKFAAEQ